MSVSPISQVTCSHAHLLTALISQHVSRRHKLTAQTNAGRLQLAGPLLFHSLRCQSPQSPSSVSPISQQVTGSHTQHASRRYKLTGTKEGRSQLTGPLLFRSPWCWSHPWLHSASLAPSSLECPAALQSMHRKKEKTVSCVKRLDQIRCGPQLCTHTACQNQQCLASLQSTHKETVY